MKCEHEDLAAEIRDWSLDVEAQKRFWPLRATKVCGILGALSLVAAVVFGVLVVAVGSPLFPVVIAIGGGFGLFVLAGLLKTVVARKATLLCSKCRQPMVYREFNYPSDSRRLAPGTTYETMRMQETIAGGSGRLYALHTDLRHKAKTQASRLLQAVRVCERCERFVVTEAMIFRNLGTKRKHIEAAEGKAREAEASGGRGSRGGGGAAHSRSKHSQSVRAHARGERINFRQLVGPQGVAAPSSQMARWLLNGLRI